MHVKLHECCGVSIHPLFHSVASSSLTTCPAQTLPFGHWWFTPRAQMKVPFEDPSKYLGVGGPDNLANLQVCCVACMIQCRE